MRVEAFDLFQVRLLLLIAERKVLKAQLAQNEANQRLLEIEAKYGLLAGDATLDIRTGNITVSATQGEELNERH